MDSLVGGEGLPLVEVASPCYTEVDVSEEAGYRTRMLYVCNGSPLPHLCSRWSNLPGKGEGVSILILLLREWRRGR